MAKPSAVKKNPVDVQRAAFYRNQVIAWIRRFKPEVEIAIKDLAEKKFPKKDGERKRIKLDKELESISKGE